MQVRHIRQVSSPQPTPGDAKWAFSRRCSQFLFIDLPGLTWFPPARYASAVKRFVLSAILVVTLLAGSTARADSIHDGRGSFTGIEIIGFTEDRLAFRMADGRILSRPAASVKTIRVVSSHDRMAEVLTEAEKLVQANNPLEAIAHYKQVEANARTTWMQDFAVFRQAQVQDKIGAFPQALAAYMILTQRAPRIAAAVIPRNFPAPKTPEAAEAVDAVKFAERSSPPEDVAAILVRLRHCIQNGTPFEKREPTTKPASRKPKNTDTDDADNPATDKPPASKPPAGKKPAGRPTTPPGDGTKPKPPVATSRPASGKIDGLAKLVRKAIADGDLDLATKTIDRAKGHAKGVDRGVYLLLTGELLLAQKYYDRAGVECMRVVVEYPGSPAMGRALYCTGLAYEGLERPAKALELYEESIRNSPQDAETREAAAARVKALQKDANPAEIP